MEDVTSFARLGPGRGSEPLTPADRDRLRTLARQSSLTADQEFELGGLRARSRHSSPADRELGHSSGNKRRGVTARDAGQTIAEAVADALIDAIDAELDRDAGRRD